MAIVFLTDYFWEGHYVNDVKNMYGRLFFPENINFTNQKPSMQIDGYKVGQFFRLNTSLVDNM